MTSSVARAVGNEQLASIRHKTEVLIEALPWLQRFHGATIVVKCSGTTLADSESQRAFAEDMVFLRLVGLRPVVVHGGGPQITKTLRRLNLNDEFRGGLRVTSPEVMDVVRMVLVGRISRDLVGMINTYGPYAVGISGEDAQLFTARRKLAIVDGQPVDVGLVGDIVKVNPGIVREASNSGRIPVVSTVAPDSDGLAHNVNADTAASALAVALRATKFVILTDVEGLYRNWPDLSSIVEKITVAELERLLPRLVEGMIPKMEACIHATRGGVPAAHVIDGRLPHSVLLEVFTSQGVGTMIVANGEGA